MRIFITGATGFVGSRLVRDLCETTGHEITVLKREHSNMAVLEEVISKINVFTIDGQGDNIYEILQQARPEIVIHLATLFLGSHQRQQVEPLIQSNILFPTKLLDAMASCGVCRFINTGSFSEYLDCKPEYDPANLYSATKRSFEDILIFYVKAYGWKAVTLKLFDTYGPHDSRPKMFSLLKKSLKNGLKVDFSPGEQQIDLIHVHDVVAAYKKTIDYLMTDRASSYETFLIGSGTSRTLKEIVRTFEAAAGKSISINWGGRPYREREIMFARADTEKAQTLLGWQPEIPLMEGLKNMITEENKNDRRH